MTETPETPIRLAFVLPDFTRTSWVSERAREAWENRLKAISRAWKAIEIQSVRCGIRDSAIIGGCRGQLDQQEAELAGTGLVAKVLARTRPGNGYSNSIEIPRAGEVASLRFAIGRSDAVERLSLAYQERDVVGVGAELGYPPCCCDFFHATCVQAELHDTTWPMAVSSSLGHPADNYSVECSGHPLANILWRYLGVRAVPHLPCRFDCMQTVSLAERMLSLGRRLGFEREIADLRTVLSWPVEWSALHGIAEIKTPILKIITRTDATAHKYRVRRIGDCYPFEGAAGLTFPFQESGKPTFSSSQSFRAGLLHGAANGETVDGPRLGTSGFVSLEAMDAAHAPLVRAAEAVLGDSGGAVLDLGCGNGALLKKICAVTSGTSPYGIDRNVAAIMAARLTMPSFANNFHIGDLRDESPLYRNQYSLAVLGLRRLDEAGPGLAQVLLARLTDCADNILVYAYAERGQHVSVSEHAARFGLEVHQPAGHQDRVSWARVLRKHDLPADKSAKRSAIQKGQISFIVVVRDEPPQLLERTIEGLLKTSAGYAREIVVVDDGSCVPAHLCQSDVRLVRRAEPMGTARARRYGASIAPGDVLAFMDAHMRFAPDWLDRMLAHVETGALLCAAWWDHDLTRPLCWGADFAWCGERNYAAGRSPGFAMRHRTKYPGDGAVEVPMLIGACYMMLRSSWVRVGGFSPFFRTWGKLEPDISLRAWLVGLEIKCVTAAHVGHFTRPKHPYPVRWEDVEYNQVAMVRTAFEQPVCDAIEALLRPLPAEVQSWVSKVDFTAYGHWVRSHRCLSDTEFLGRFVPSAPECLMRAASGEP